MDTASLPPVLPSVAWTPLSFTFICTALCQPQWPPPSSSASRSLWTFVHTAPSNRAVPSSVSFLQISQMSPPLRGPPWYLVYNNTHPNSFIILFLPLSCFIFLLDTYHSLELHCRFYSFVTRRSAPWELGLYFITLSPVPSAGTGIKEAWVNICRKSLWITRRNAPLSCHIAEELIASCCLTQRNDL